MECYEKITLFNSEFRIFSQNREDGILQYIFSKVDTTNRCFVEFGVGNGRECNTANLSFNCGWNGLIMDGSEKDMIAAKQYYADRLKEDSGRVRIFHCFITAENIEEVLAKNGIAGEIDLLSIDIDGVDYWVWKAIREVNPRVVVIEYNASLDHDKSLTVKYDPNFDRHEKHKSGWYAGASLTALTKLAESKGYCLVGCDSWGVNAFFVRNDVAKDKINSISVQEAFYPHKYRLEKMTHAEQVEYVRHLDFEEVE